MDTESKKNPIGFTVARKDDDKNPESSAVDTIQKNNQENNEDNEEYTDVSSVTISLVKNYSLYRQVNSKVLPKRVDYIGSSVNASRILSSNKREVEKYFPNIIGLSPNNDKFITEVKIWLGNIRIAVDELGKTFDTSFHYFKKSDYYKFKARLEKIEEDYNRVNRNNLDALKKALEIKISLINDLESEKCTVGYPINIEDYLMYRHCLLYRDVAKDIAVINSDANIRFYFKDDVKEAEKAKKYREQVVRAKANYVNAMADDKLFEAIYIQYCILNNFAVIPSLGKPAIDKEIELDEFSKNEPRKFNEIFNNKDIKLMASIEKLIGRGELIRSENNQQISLPDGTKIGANMNEAVAWFKNVENTSAVNAFLARLKNY